MHFIHVQVNFHSFYVFFGELGSESQNVLFLKVRRVWAHYTCHPVPGKWHHMTKLKSNWHHIHFHKLPFLPIVHLLISLNLPLLPQPGWRHESTIMLVFILMIYQYRSTDIQRLLRKTIWILYDSYTIADLWRHPSLSRILQQLPVPQQHKWLWLCDDVIGSAQSNQCSRYYVPLIKCVGCFRSSDDVLSSVSQIIS